ncbi:MAG: glycosyltransferase family 4 protein [Bacillota bacterium]
MRVSLLAYGLHRGGRSRIICRLANGLTARGHDVTVLLLSGQPVAYPLYAQVHRVPELTEPAIPRSDLVVPTSFGLVPVAMERKGAVTVPLYTRFEPDLVYDHPTATRICGFPLPAIATAEPVARRLQQLSGRPCHVAQPGVDRSTFQPLPPARHEGPRRVCFLYRPEALGYGHKGNSDFWQAMELVRQHEPDLGLSLIVPDGLPVECPLPHRVEVVATDQELAACYRSAALYVAASRTDGYQLSVLEAMACGVPVVLTDSGGVRDYATPGENCFMGLAGNVPMLADLMLAALRRPDMTEGFVANGQATARERTWDRFVDQAEAALLACLKAGG